MTWWQNLFGSSTRGRIVALLRRGERSVDELAAELGVTDNAVRAQLSSLARDGVVAERGPRRDGTVGKPATMYGISLPAERAFSAAYAPTLATLLRVLRARMAPDQLDAVLRETGQQLAGHTASASAPLATRVQAGMSALAQLGAVAEVHETANGFVIEGSSCPLGEAVEACPNACRTVEQLLAEIARADVRERCKRNAGAPRCSFEIVERSGTPALNN